RRVNDALAERTAEITGRKPNEFRIVIENGKPVPGILRAAKAARADLLVVGPDSSDAASVAERVARHAACAVLVARPSRGTGAVVAGTDLSDPSFGAVTAALDLARARKGALTVVHVIEMPSYSLSRLYKLFGQTPPAHVSKVDEARERVAS